MSQKSPAGRAPTGSVDPWAGISVEFRRSAKRRRTISARLDGNRLIVHVPTGLTADQENEWARRLGTRILASRRRDHLNGDRALLARARDLNDRLFGGRLKFKDVRYVTNQQGRFGSCTPATGKIRIADRVASMPAWVRDAVVVHELAHLAEANHSPRFWDLANRYPLMERARGYLIAVGLDDEMGRGDDPGGSMDGGLAGEFTPPRPPPSDPAPRRRRAEDKSQQGRQLKLGEWG